MDTSALRKLSLTLKPLIEIAEVLEKIEGAEQQLASIQGKTVAAQRDYDALVSKMVREKDEADAKIVLSWSKAKEDASDIIARAKSEAETITQRITGNETKRLDELRKKIEKAERESAEWDDRVKKMIVAANETEARLKIAEKGLAELRAAHAAVRI